MEKFILFFLSENEVTEIIVLSYFVKFETILFVKGSSAVADPVPLRMKLEGPPTVVGN